MSEAIIDKRLRQIVLASGEDAQDEAPVARLAHYLVAIGGKPPEPADALDIAAAEEIMESMGRVAPELLHERRAMIRARAASRLAAAEGVPAEVRQGTGAEAVDMVASEISHGGFFLTRTMRLRHPVFEGGLSGEVRREVFVATDAALVLPYDPQRDRVLLVEQFRMGPYGRGDPRPWMLEPIAGRVDAGETPEDTARREAREEAGLELTTLEHIASHYCSPGCSTEYFHLYLGIADLAEDRQGRGGLEAEHEDIRTHVLDYAGAMRLLETGEADNGPLILSLIWLSRERARLRAEGTR